MKREHDVRALLRWYPKDWRDRYGEEFVALVHDSVGEGTITLSLRRSIAISGLLERSHHSGLIGERSTVPVQRRTGSLVVLVAWAVMSVGGLSLFKSAEHFSNALPTSARTVPQVAYDVVAAAGILGSLLVVIGAGIAMPALIRFLRGGGWLDVRNVFAGLMLTGVVLAGATIGLGIWAHHLTWAQRNGADSLYAAAFVLYVFEVVVSIGVAIRATIVVVTKLDLSPGVLRSESIVALGVCAATLAVAASSVVWWFQMSLHAPWFLRGTVPGVAVSPWSMPMIVASSIMLVAMTGALFGASRVAVSYRRAH
ncbi:MAG: hypothetical protein HIU84_00020 [Acidobacteria bacterium]|nr:hypothetical protein [Acidobacteriota bacterium]